MQSAVAILLQRRHQIFFFQSELFALVAIGQFVGRLVPDLRRHCVIEESAILHYFAVRDRVFKATISGFDGEVHHPCLARLHGRIEGISLI